MARPRGTPSPPCTDALAEADRAIARRAYAEVGEPLARADGVCGSGMGVHWRRGFVARQEQRFDVAAWAFLDELAEPKPMPATGAQLLAVLPDASGRARRAAARLGAPRRPITGGFAGVETERIAMMRCGGRNVALLLVACSRSSSTCTYTFRCEHGGTRRIVEMNEDLWFATSPSLNHAIR